MNHEDLSFYETLLTDEVIQALTSNNLLGGTVLLFLREHGAHTEKNLSYDLRSLDDRIKDNIIFSRVSLQNALRLLQRTELIEKNGDEFLVSSFGWQIATLIMETAKKG